jgi:hypothetical protein
MHIVRRHAGYMDIKNLPRCPLELRGFLFAESASEVLKLSIPYTREEYHQNNLVIDCIYFVMDDLLDTARSDFDSLGRVWLFPVTEAHSELELALTACLTGMYKSVYDHLRRAVEVTVVGCYFLMEHISESEAKAWLKSEKETPLFSRATRGLEKNERFAGLESSSGWLTELKSFYWHLSDAIHVRGTAYSLQRMQPTVYSFNGVRTLSFSKTHLSHCLDNYILAVRHIAVCRAAENPILLVGLPIEEKFGINGPMSGFFETRQSDALWELLLDKSVPFFRQLVETDEEVKSVKEGFNSLPGISEEELQKQLNEFRSNYIKNV